MKVFIDGSAGTTGLRIRERLALRPDIELAILPEEKRKDVSARKDAINAADAVFLCLPDAAAVEAAQMCENPDTVIVDTSTAHRTDPAWQYGFPEIAGMREKIARSKRIANPGCHASGFIALVEPLVRAGIVPADSGLSAFSLTGYSGGGKKMIAQYDDLERGPLFDGGRQYALSQTHKHLPEMAKVCGLSHPPVFSPVVVDHYSGMEVTVSLPSCSFKGTLEDIRNVYADAYGAGRGGTVRFAPDAPADGFISSCALSGTDSMLVGAWGNAERIVLVSVFDNLGKGASGAAVQNMNLATGTDELYGLDLYRGPGM